MAIDSKKLKQVLNHHDQFREKFETDIGTYQKYKKNTNFVNKLVSNWAEVAYGPMKQLRNEIGLKDLDQATPVVRYG